MTIREKELQKTINKQRTQLQSKNRMIKRRDEIITDLFVSNENYQKEIATLEDRVKMLAGKTIVLGVTGSIAAYKAAELASQLTQAGARVEVIMTEASTEFVSPLTFRSITGRPVVTKMFEMSSEYSIEHVALAEAADETICLRMPSFFSAVGQFYIKFDQIRDEDVLEILKSERSWKEGQ